MISKCDIGVFRSEINTDFSIQWASSYVVLLLLIGEGFELCRCVLLYMCTLIFVSRSVPSSKTLLILLPNSLPIYCILGKGFLGVVVLGNMPHSMIHLAKLCSCLWKNFERGERQVNNAHRYKKELPMLSTA